MLSPGQINEAYTTDTEYYEGIVTSLVNGQTSQVRTMFNKMDKYYKKEFLVDFLDIEIGYHKSVLNVCIEELTN